MDSKQRTSRGFPRPPFGKHRATIMDTGQPTTSAGTRLVLQILRQVTPRKMRKIGVNTSKAPSAPGLWMFSRNTLVAYVTSFCRGTRHTGLPSFTCSSLPASCCCTSWARIFPRYINLLSIPSSTHRFLQYPHSYEH